MHAQLFIILAGCAVYALAGEAVTSEVVNPGPEPKGKSPEDNKQTKDGKPLVQGDMVVKGGKSGSNRNAILSEDMKWPKVRGNVVVPYVLDRSLSRSARSAIQAAIQDYTDNTCVRWVQRTNQRYYVNFFRGDGCYSYVGYFQEAGQEISIGDGCEYKGTAAHEMMHCLGFDHEQSRPDRDQYVTILLQNVDPENHDQFAKCQDCTTQGLPYDYGSVMHYGTDYFSINDQDTIRPKQRGARIGQRSGLTRMDIQKVNKLYGC